MKAPKGALLWGFPGAILLVFVIALAWFVIAQRAPPGADMGPEHPPMLIAQAVGHVVFGKGDCGRGVDAARQQEQRRQAQNERFLPN